MATNTLDNLLSGRTMRVYIDADLKKGPGSYKPEDVLFDSLQGEERLSHLATFTVRVLHHSDKLNLGILLGKTLTVEIQTSVAPRYVGGLITHCRLIGSSDNNNRYYSYEFKVAPWLWLSTLKKEYRIYQNLTIPQIISEVLYKYGFDYEFQLIDEYESRDYCVQYGESDFNFVSRLLEEEGIHYYFQYSETKHTLIMTDSLLTHNEIKGYEQVPYFENDKLAHVHTEYLSQCQVVENLRSTRFSTKDYDFLGPFAPLDESSAWSLRHSHHPEAEVYEWPGGYITDAIGERYARRRAEELQYQREYLQFRGTVRGLETGAAFCLQNDPKPSRVRYESSSNNNIDYIVLSTYYDLQESPYQSLVGQPNRFAQSLLADDTVPAEVPSQQKDQYRCVMHLTVQDKTQPFRPLRTSPKPRTYGPQTAVVVGPSGQEIWTNEHGQVKVHFQWDRYDQEDEHSSCWVRVSSAWASNSFGAIQIPRIGDEVIVDFLNGDPDYPIITGRVFNARNMPPWKLPDNATQMGIYSRSSPDGIYQTANALRFEDKMSHEEVYLHAQKDQNIKIKNNYSKRIDVNKIESVGHNKGVEVSNNHYEVIGGDMALFVGPTQKGRFTPPNAN